MNGVIDTSFDFREDSGGRDPDSFSPTLRRYHQLLWSKPLPDGSAFDLDTDVGYLHHRSELGEFWLSSDSVIPTYLGYPALAAITNQLSVNDRSEFLRLAYTIGGMLVFPGQKVGNKLTINGARGFHPRIKDRMDLTLECIRRHYGGQPSPLEATLARYADFFRLFETFAGYADFFLLQDLVTSDGESVRFLLPFADFKPPTVPADIDSYRRYRDLTAEFITSRNTRIDRLGL